MCFGTIDSEYYCLSCWDVKILNTQSVNSSWDILNYRFSRYLKNTRQKKNRNFLTWQLTVVTKSQFGTFCLVERLCYICVSICTCTCIYTCVCIDACMYVYMQVKNRNKNCFLAHSIKILYSLPTLWGANISISVMLNSYQKFGTILFPNKEKLFSLKERKK